MSSSALVVAGLTAESRENVFMTAPAFVKVFLVHLLNPLSANTTKCPNTFKQFRQLFECVWPFCGVGAYKGKLSSPVKYLSSKNVKGFYLLQCSLIRFVTSIYVFYFFYYLGKRGYRQVFYFKLSNFRISKSFSILLINFMFLSFEIWNSFSVY